MIKANVHYTFPFHSARSRSKALLSGTHLNKVPPVKQIEQGKATWDDLIGHCRSDHPKSCQDLERLSPTQITEMKQRMKSGEISYAVRV